MEVKLDVSHPGFTSSVINSNFTRVSQFVNYYPLKRQVSYPEEPNEMWTDLDMGGMRITNVTNGNIVTLKDLPPQFLPSDGLRLSQSVLEALHKPPSELRLSQSLIEVLITSASDLRLSQSVLEVISVVSEQERLDSNEVHKGIIFDNYTSTQNTAAFGMQGVSPWLYETYIASMEAWEVDTFVDVSEPNHAPFNDQLYDLQGTYKHVVTKL